VLGSRMREGVEWCQLISKALAHSSRDNEYCSQVHVKPCKEVASKEAIDLFCSLVKTKERRKTEAVAKRTPKMLHDFAWLAFVCSVRPDIVIDAKVRIDGKVGHVI
jgi:hypothetical protein